MHTSLYLHQQVPEDGLTLFEAKSWVKGLLGRSPYLAKLFSVDFKFGELSSYARQTISPMTQFEMGLVTLPDLKYRSAKDAVRFRKLLHPDFKLTIHERAMGSGADDPLKPDYSRFLPKSKTRTLTNVVPLEHGHLTNLTVGFIRKLSFLRTCIVEEPSRMTANAAGASILVCCCCLLCLTAGAPVRYFDALSNQASKLLPELAGEAKSGLSSKKESIFRRQKRGAR